MGKDKKKPQFTWIKQAEKENSVDVDQLASKKPADLHLHCFKTEYIQVQQDTYGLKSYENFLYKQG